MNWKDRSQTGDVLYQHFPTGNEKNNKKTSVSVASIRAEIRTGHILSASPEHYHCSNFWAEH